MADINKNCGFKVSKSYVLDFIVNNLLLIINIISYVLTLLKNIDMNHMRLHCEFNS